MGRTVNELLDSLDADELVHWLAYDKVDPWDESRGDYRNGLLCSVIANAIMNTDKFKPGDFIPTFGPQELTTNVDDDLLLLQGMKWAKSYGGTIGKA